MENPIYHPSAIIAITTGAMVIIGGIVQWVFLIGLRRKHSEQWHHAGSPTIWSDQSLFSAWPTVKYMQNKEYLTSGDASGIIFCNFFRIPFVLLYWSTVISFVALVISIFIFGWPKE